MVYTTIDEFVKDYKSATFGLTIVTLTTVKKKVCGQVIQKLKVTENASVGIDYYHALRSLAARQGITFASEKDFLAAYPKEGTYAAKTDLKAVYEHERTHQRYLRTYEGRGITKVTKVVYFDEVGNAITDNAMLNAIKAIDKSSTCAKQSDLGLTSQLLVKQPKVENVLFLKQGDKVYESAKFATYKQYL